MGKFAIESVWSISSDILLLRSYPQDMYNDVKKINVRNKRK